MENLTVKEKLQMIELFSKDLRESSLSMHLYISLPTTKNNTMKSTLEYPLHFGDKTRAFHSEHVITLTNRTLLKDTRRTVERLEDIRRLEYQGSRFYLGERIGKQRSNTMSDLKAYQFEIDRRYKVGAISVNK